MTPDTSVFYDCKELLLKTATPALMARTVSRGRWKPAPHLMFLDELIVNAVSGRGSDRLLVQMPPRHGKSEYISKHVPPWYLGTFPDRRVILSSYGDTFSAKWGRQSRNIMEEWGSSLFGVRVAQDSSAADNWSISGRSGGMRTCGVGGGITGEGADLLIIDDPVKDAEQASSKLYRDKTWDWWQGTIGTRLEPGAICIIVMTRWHEDDLVGRLLADGSEPWVECKFPAIAKEDDILGRCPGDALWPERYDVEALDRIRKRAGSLYWHSLYQQEPTAPEGDRFKRSWFHTISPSELPADFNTKGKAVRYWDKAGTEGGGDHTAGVLLVQYGARYYVVDVVHGQWGAANRKLQMRMASERDSSRFQNYTIWQEQEAGSGGKESAELTEMDLSDYRVRTEKPTGAKSSRYNEWEEELDCLTNPRTPTVYLVEGSWNRAFVDEHCSWRWEHKSPTDDQIDAVSGAYMKLRKKRSFSVAVA